jgi:hypothetical protein
MAKIKKFGNMEVWQQARSITKAIYVSSRQGEFARDFGLRDQIQRASSFFLSPRGQQEKSDHNFISLLILDTSKKIHSII